ncbi:MAG TPA: hypothetical protein VN634_11155 [Candidatus Limnocylindrales bacterium]|nr:hypothetical protein [Candidatus Limnocylindrales bacterium]
MTRRGAVCFVLALIASASTAAAAPGQIRVNFTIASSEFQRGLGTARQRVEEDLAGRLAVQLQAPFPLLDWLTAPSTPESGSLSAILVEEGTPIPEIKIQWSARIGNTLVSTPHLDTIGVYGASALDRPYHNPEQLIRDVNAKLSAWIQTDAGQAKLHQDFVTQVSFADKVEFDSTTRAIVIPLEWKRAMLGDDTEFQLEFATATPPAGFRIKLDGVSERRGPPMPGNTQCKPSDCFEDGTSVSSDVVWNKCVGILLAANPPPLSVRVKKYIFDAHAGLASRDGTAVTP